MSELDVMKLRGLVLASADGRSTPEVIAFIRDRHGKELGQVVDYLIDKALSGMLQSGSRRKASMSLNDGFDLFGEFPVRGTRKIEVRTSGGKTVKRYRRMQDLTLSELQDEIQRLERRKLPEHKEIVLLKKMYERASKFGDESTTVGLALQKAHQND